MLTIHELQFFIYHTNDFGTQVGCRFLIGGNSETQELLDFCGKHNITSAVGIINVHAIKQVYERMLKSDVKYRFVIDMKSIFRD